ncbi:MAG TPA: ATP-binding cassette domain-containing protein [Limnochordia bacterium]|nr:ATP-binding cassette domain-containing protein [Limnochordia bacterium]
MSAIVVSGLAKSYVTYRKGEGLRGSLRALFKRERVVRAAVRGVDFAIAPGERVGFLGPNGAGKTTTMKMLAGILYPSAGSAAVLGYVPWERKKAFLRQFALVMGQKAQLDWDLPAADSFALNRDIYELDHATYRRRLGEIVELFELGDVLHVPVRQLSLGERMKCELAASLLHGPKVLLLDEPTIGLDLVAQKRLRQFLRAYAATHDVTLMLTSHYMQDVKELCERVIVIDRGAIGFDGNLAALTAQAAVRRISVVFAEPVAGGRLEAVLGPLGGITGREGDQWGVRLECERAALPTVVGALMQAFAVDDLKVEEPDIDDVIGELFARVRAAHDA